MKHAKLFSILVFAIIGLYGSVGFYFLPLANFEGDLTRIGLLPESMFGWTRPQPAIEPALMRQASLETADVLVVGDSFSKDHVWQTELVSRGLQVRTENWISICEDFAPWLRGKGFRGKYVVIESVERDASSRLAESIGCKKMNFRHRVEVDAPRRPPKTILDLDGNKFSGRLSIGPQVWLNASKYQRLSASPDFKTWQATDGASVKRVAQGCVLFSHPQCQDALFMSLDQAQDLGADAIDNLLALDKRFEGLTAIWVIVPNKSTAYLYPEKHFWDEAERRAGAVNVLKVVRQAIAEHVVDVYRGNDTHLSTAGYLLMGDAIYQKIQQ